ncbi:unnamed protein product [Ectocarpus sp. 12 AP-2014]
MPRENCACTFLLQHTTREPHLQGELFQHRLAPQRSGDVGNPMKVHAPASPLVFNSSRTQQVPPDTKKRFHYRISRVSRKSLLTLRCHFVIASNKDVNSLCVFRSRAFQVKPLFCAPGV